MNNNNSSVSTIKLAGGRYISTFLIVISLCLGVGLGLLLSSLFNNINSKRSVLSENTQSSFYDVEYVESVYKKFLDDYIGEIPSKDELTYGMIKGLISSLNDPYTYFLTPDETKSYLESRSPDFEGIGVTLKLNENNTEIESVLPGYPAEKAGMKSGDVIIKVGEESTEGLQPSVVATKIRGKKGTEVKIDVFRPESSQVLSFTPIREKIEIDNVNYKNLGNGIYKINIVQFIDESIETFNKSWDTLVSDITRNNDVKGIVVDLRNNPGGYVNSVKYVLEEFLSDNQIMMFEETKDTGRLEFRDYRNGKFENVPVVVIVNEGSASASEIFAAAIQDNDRGEIIGMPTVGKGVEQQLVSGLPDSSMIVMVFQKWLTPNGRNITKESSIIPDIEIDYSMEDYSKGVDTQLNKALELLK